VKILMTNLFSAVDFNLMVIIWLFGIMDQY
jgi:hypothetical protein